ncbi:MAG: TadG family pilus assembly protein [Phycisphaerae bacterium]
MDHQRLQSRGNRHGVAALQAVLIFTLLVGVVTFGVEFGRLTVARQELQGAADAAARAAAAMVHENVPGARSAARHIAQQALAAGTAVELSDADIVPGRWDSNARTFTPTLTSPNAVRVTVSRTAGGGNAVPSGLAGVFGINGFDVTRTAVAVRLYNAGYGLVGLDGIEMDGTVDIDSYDSAVESPVTNGSGRRTGHAASNGTITVRGQTEIWGDLYHGPSGGVKLIGKPRISGRIIPLDNEVVLPDPQLPDTYTTLGNVNVTSGTYTLSAGKYVVNKFKLSGSARLRLTGPVEIYANDEIDLGARVETYQNRPRNFKLTAMSDEDVKLSGYDRNMMVDLYAPYSDITLGAKLDVYGRIVGKSIDFVDGSDISVDEDLTRGQSSVGSKPVIVTVQ